MGSSSQVIGYWYQMMIHMGISRGPIDALVRIKVGDRVAWDGTGPLGVPIVSSGVYPIHAPELFGGEKGEGGITGPLAVCMGEPTQPIPILISGLIGGLQPAFRGVTSLIFWGYICANNPYPKPWKMRVRRALNGWDGDVWYPEKVIVEQCTDTKAMNPAHILYECATNRDWGRGLPAWRLDLASFTVAADRLYAECFGLCMRWNRQEDLQAFAQRVIDHIGGAMYIDRGTGLLTLRLIRQDYDPEALPTFTSNSGLLEITEDSTASADGLVNEVVLTYHDQVEDEDRQVRVQNLASIQAQKAMYSQSVAYPGIACPDLALRVAQRDLRSSGLNLKRFKVTLDRRGWKVTPAGVFKISSPERGIESLILRAGRIEDSSDGTGRIVITAVQDIFGLPDVAYTEVQPYTYEPVPQDLVPVEEMVVVEATYRDTKASLSAADFAALTPDTGGIMILAEAPSTGSIDYVPSTSTSAVTTTFTDYARTRFAVTGQVDAVSLSATQITVRDIKPDMTNALALLATPGPAYVGNEIVEVSSVVASGTDWVTLNVKRGVIDTVPVAHLSGEHFYYYRLAAGTDNVAYAEGETVYAAALTRTTLGVVEIDDALVESIEIAGRFDLPYPPGDIEINGEALGATDLVEGDIVITWAERNRITQGDQLVGQLEGTITPEAGTTYTLNIRDASDDSLIRAFTGITGTTQTYSDANATTDGYQSPIIVELFAVRDGLESWQKYRIELRHEASGTDGFGFGFGTNFGG